MASLAILSTSLTHGGQHFVASGLSSVVTDQTQRGRGHGHRLITAAHDLIANSGVATNPTAEFSIRNSLDRSTAPRHR